MSLSALFFWHHKTPQDNAWHPNPSLNPSLPSSPSSSSPTSSTTSPPFLLHTDLASAAVDISPFIAGAGGFAHLSQLHAFGFTASASIFRNPRTLKAMHWTTLLLIPLVLCWQGFDTENAGAGYRDYIPRWAHERERGRDEREVRGHVEVGMGIGAGLWVGRTIMRMGARYWAPMEVVMGGGLADLAHREYIKAHSGM